MLHALKTFPLHGMFRAMDFQDFQLYVDRILCSDLFQVPLRLPYRPSKASSGTGPSLGREDEADGFFVAELPDHRD